MQVDAKRSKADISHADAAVWFPGINQTAGGGWSTRENNEGSSNPPIVQCYWRSPSGSHAAGASEKATSRIPSVWKPCCPISASFARRCPTVSSFLPSFGLHFLSILDIRAGVSVEIEGFSIEGWRLTFGLVEFRMFC